MSLVPLDGDTSHLRETCIEARQAWRGAFLDIRSDRVALPDGSETCREYVVHPGAVMIVPLLGNDRVIVERQWRYPMGRAMLEFPAGKLEPAEPPLVCAQRELLEETGYTATEWARIGVIHNAIAYSSEHIEVWFARGLSLGPAQLDEGEFVEVTTVAVDALDALAAAGTLTDSKTLFGLLWLHNWRAGRWSIAWQRTS